MKLADVLVGVAPGAEISEVEVTSVVSDSRKVQPGSIFVAYSGVAIDGHNFVPQAVKAGAVAVVGEKKLSLSLPYFRVKNGRLAWARMVANLSGNPEKKLKFIGVTGTDGKTTTTNLIYQMLLRGGIRAAMVSTIKAVIGDEEYDTGLHTSSPDPDILWGWLAEIVAAGQTHVVLETTSHGLAQYRFGEIKFDVGVLTNLAHDHLEFHKTIEGYRDAKAMLFENSAVSVINECSQEADFFKGRAAGKVIGYDAKKETRLIEYGEDSKGFFQEGEIKLGGVFRKIKTRLLGEYNLENILAASKAAVELGVSDEAIINAVETMEPLPGRFQKVANKKGIRAIVDFAHTEQGLRSVVSLVGNHLRKEGERIIVVFGCNGERDQTKRAPMGRAAGQLADLVVVTTEDPRRESVEAIYRQIEDGLLSAGGVLGETFFREDDRGAAIGLALGLAKKGDWVLFLGKGHEKSMNIGGVEYPWDEVVEVAKRLA